MYILLQLKIILKQGIQICSVQLKRLLFHREISNYFPQFQLFLPSTVSLVLATLHMDSVTSTNGISSHLPNIISRIHSVLWSFLLCFIHQPVSKHFLSDLLKFLICWCPLLSYFSLNTGTEIVLIKNDFIASYCWRISFTKLHLKPSPLFQNANY